MPDNNEIRTDVLNSLDKPNLREHIRYFIGAVRTDPENLASNATTLADLTERLLDRTDPTT